MRRLGVTGFAVSVFLGLLALAPAAHAAPVSFSLVGTSGANGWYTSDVTIRWAVEQQDLISAPNCPAAELLTTEGATNRQCVATFTWGTVTSPVVTVRIDKTAPTASGGASRGPDSNGWYNHPVSFGFSGTDAVSGIASCSSPTYGGGDGASVSVSGTCTDMAGNTSPAASVSFQYDATPPVVSATPDRPPDGAWYRRPLSVSFAGSDATSGIAACTAPVGYKGPEGEGASVKGSCSDAAGNGAETTFGFKYDATAPKLGKPKAVNSKGLIQISWVKEPDVAATQLVRKPGLRGAKSSVVYRGAASSYTDKSVRAGARYQYELVVGDAAGNLSGRVVTVRARPPLYRPAAGQRVRGPLTLAWEAVAGVRFYNVQLLRNGVKVLSVWPRKPQLRVNRSWRYAGETQRLTPGRYRWYVWGARGTRVRPEYGRPLGTSTFRVRA
jgi:hypothetical protein